jgi:hypothetical protein
MKRLCYVLLVLAGCAAEDEMVTVTSVLLGADGSAVVWETRLTAEEDAALVEARQRRAEGREPTKLGDASVLIYQTSCYDSTSFWLYDGAWYGAGNKLCLVGPGLAPLWLYPYGSSGNWMEKATGLWSGLQPGQVSGYSYYYGSWNYAFPPYHVHMFDSDDPSIYPIWYVFLN